MKHQLLDQYGDTIPNDLVIIPNLTYLSNEDVDTVDKARWYDCKGIILVSAKEINYIDTVSPLDAGIDVEDEDIYYIGTCLHRFSEVDGFYHA